jgi:GH24 family phage-related lysozyme (muramidase)
MSLQQMRDHIRQNEDAKDWPYLDSKGLITIGPGLLIRGHDDAETEAGFVALPLQVKDQNTSQLRAATLEEKHCAYRAMAAEQAKGPGNRSAEAYRAVTRVVLPPAEQDRLLDQQIATRVEAIKKEVGGDAWERLSDGQKAAVLDIHYNSGSLNGYRQLKNAIRAGDALGMATHAIFHSGENPDGTLQRNWERLARDQAAILGVSQEEGRRIIADRFPGEAKFDGRVAASSPAVARGPAAAASA